MVPTSQRSFTCCSFSMFLGMDNESSHSSKDADPYSLNIANVAGSVVAIETTGWLSVGGTKAEVGIDWTWPTDEGIGLVVEIQTVG